MDWNSKADRLIRKYDRHKQGIGNGQGVSTAHGWLPGQNRRDHMRGEMASIETPSFAHGSQHMMFKKKSKSQERAGGG